MQHGSWTVQQIVYSRREQCEVDILWKTGSFSDGFMREIFQARCFVIEVICVLHGSFSLAIREVTLRR
jgi:hypothetical protein